MTGDSKKLRSKTAACAALVLAAGTLFLGSLAMADDCAARCYAAENACRKATQGSSTCDAQLTRCLQSCRTQR